MANQSISQINSSQTSWNVKAKVIRLWVVSDMNRNTLPFLVEMILLDAEGGRIHATIKKTLIYKFRNQIIEGNVYLFENMSVASYGGSYRTVHHPFKLNFKFSTRVVPLPNATINLSPYHFVPISDIVGGSYDTDYLVDVIGVLTGVGTEREVWGIGKTTKLNVIALEASGHKIQCTLFGSYVDDLNTFMASGDLQNVVVIIQLAKVKLFQEKIHIQNSMGCTKLVFNPSCADGDMMRNRLTDNADSPLPLSITPLNGQLKTDTSDDFLYNTPRITIQGLKDCTKESIFVVLGTITEILNPENWWYTACVCTKSVYPDSKMYFCKKCNKHVMKVYPRYCIKVRVIDNYDSATLVIFDRDASVLFNKSCAEMLQAHDKTAGEGILPPELMGLLDTTILFKVETKPVFSLRFGQSFRVRKICTKEIIINQFKQKWDKEEAIFLENNKTNSLSVLVGTGKDKVGVSDTHVLSQGLEELSGNEGKGNEKMCEGKGKEKMDTSCISLDLMPKFSQAGLEDEVEILALPIDSVNTSVKRGSPNEDGLEDHNLPLKLLKRAIKIKKI